MTLRILSLAALLVLGGCALGGTACDSAKCAHDAEINAQVQTALSEKRDLPLEEVRVQTTNGIVYLYGIVDTELQRRIIEERAREITGVVDVVNSIGVRNGFH
ncbi:MAG TPA: BON domain-containing protein [Rudaea sp.]